MLIRKAGKSDIDSINLLDRESVLYHKKFDRDFYEISEKWWGIKKKSQLSALNKTDNLLLVAEENGKIIGYIWAYCEKIGKIAIGRIQEVVVTTKYRKKGIATALTAKTLDLMRKQKCTVCEVSVHTKNYPALKLYESCGFKKKECKLRRNLNENKSFRPFC